jgi:hypothetical protein
MKVQLIRSETSEQGTFGTLITETGFTCFTGELPWHDNEKGKSCIPAGTYPCIWHNSPSKGWVYMLQNTSPRDNILIHIANYCGAVPEYHSDLLGCIGLGESIGYLGGQRALLQSGVAVNQFVDKMKKQPFTLTIEWKDGVNHADVT